MSDEVPTGGVISRHYFERDLAIYRTGDGTVSVIDAHCPHLGSHLGRSGSVEGELLRCGVHGFCFDASGACVSTAYDGPPPVAARLARWEHRERNGVILVWFDPRARAPAWEVPALEDAGWTPMRWKRFHVDTHPQETTENSVDFGHFTQLHGFIEGEVTEPLRTDGPMLTSGYAANRPYGLPGLPLLKFRVEYDVTVAGLGYSQVDIRLPQLGWKLQAGVFPVPIDDEHIDLVVGLRADRNMGPMTAAVRFIAHRIVCKEVGQDLDVWENRRFLEQPALAKHDGPIAEYRRWAKQFYAEDA
jgi:nitrite reductase/ring-hydroxylating ferredoxin subunit